MDARMSAIASMRASVGFAKSGFAVVVPQLLRCGPPPTFLSQRVQERIDVRILHILGRHEPASVPIDLQKIGEVLLYRMAYNLSMRLLGLFGSTRDGTDVIAWLLKTKDNAQCLYRTLTR